MHKLYFTLLCALFVAFLLFCLREYLACRLKLLQGYQIVVRLFVYLYATENKTKLAYNVHYFYFSVNCTGKYYFRTWTLTLPSSIECDFFIAVLMKILVLWGMTSFRFVDEIKVSEEITASFFRVDQDFCLGYPSPGGRNTFQNLFYCTVHFDNVKILFTNKCTLY
jgi:hypothetical protein